MGKSIRDAMTESPRTIGPDGTVVEAAKIMRDEDTGIVPIATSRSGSSPRARIRRRRRRSTSPRASS